MKIDADIPLTEFHVLAPLDDSWETQLPRSHVICRDLDDTPHTVEELIWPWAAYTKTLKKFDLHFYYWCHKRGPKIPRGLEVSAERMSRVEELQFLMTRQIYFGPKSSPRTLQAKLWILKGIARFAESHSCSIRDILTQTELLDACGASMSEGGLRNWMYWVNFLSQLDPEKQLGFRVASSKLWNSLKRKSKGHREACRQHAPLPTRIYGQLINNLSTELDDIEANAPTLLEAITEALSSHRHGKETQKSHELTIGPALIEKYGLGDYLSRRGYSLTTRALASLSAAINEIYLICSLQIHVFSGMRKDEVRTLPYHCMTTEKGRHGRTHSLIAGTTTKLNKGRNLRTKWVTTEQDGFRAIRLAQRFANVIYQSLDLVPSAEEKKKDKFPLFLSVTYLPWHRRPATGADRLQPAELSLRNAKDALYARLIPIIKEEDIEELEAVDPFRAWREEPGFAAEQPWPLATHQLRRSLAVYANSSGLVRLSSLRRQLQHLSHEMSLYYGRGSTFCKNFVGNDPSGFKKHIAIEWQDGEQEAMALTFTRDVLNSEEQMFGGAGNFYQRQKELGRVMDLRDVQARIKAGLLSYKPGPLGGCTKIGGCTKHMSLALVDISCATDACSNFVGKHSKIIRVIQLKRAAMSRIAVESLDAGFEREELEALERVEREWRRRVTDIDTTGGERND